MGRKKSYDVDDTLREAYTYIRRRGSVVMRGQAFYLWNRVFGPRPTTFYASSDGTVWRNDKAALLAELRLLMLRRGLPVGFVARFDRPV